MLTIVLIWRMEKITKLKRRHHFPVHCKTYDFMKFRNFEQQIRQIKTLPPYPECQIRQLNTSVSFSDVYYFFTIHFRLSHILQ